MARLLRKGGTLGLTDYQSSQISESMFSEKPCLKVR